jgi:NAD(P)-dependent dehydrogenase (short-subunit alcohol dehydrogenase family)
VAAPQRDPVKWVEGDGYGRGTGGRTALVTGGASGIGRACAVRPAAAGAAVTVVDLRLMLEAPFRLARRHPGEVAETVAYPCAPEASFITGTTIMLDGEWSAH